MIKVTQNTTTQDSMKNVMNCKKKDPQLLHDIGTQ